MNRVDIKIISSKGAVVPCYKTEGAAGADVCALLDENVLLKKGQRTIIPTGLFFEIPQGYEIQVQEAVLLQKMALQFLIHREQLTAITVEN